MEHPAIDWILDAADDGNGDVDRATRGFVAAHPTGVVERDGRTIWDTGRYDFMRQSPEAPGSVHPSLWRQGRLNCVHGLFEVRAPDADGRGGVWQVRGYDLSNITFIAGPAMVTP